MKNFIRAKFIILLSGLVILLILVPTSIISIRARTTQAIASSAHSQVHHAPVGPYFPPVLSKSVPADWSEFHADAARDGNQATDTRLSKANANSLVPVSGPGFTTTGAAMSSPAVYQGILYYAANMPVTSGTKTLHISTMYAVNARTGIIVWSKPFPHCPNVTKSEYVFSSPAVTTGLINGVAIQEVFIGWGPITSKAGCLYNFNGRTGAVIWTYETANPINSSPAIMSTNIGNVVVVGDNGSYLHAFSVDYNRPLRGNGVQLWQYDNRYDPPPPGYEQFCLPAPELCGDAIWSSPAEGLVLVNGAIHHYAYFGVGAEQNTVGRIDAIDLDTIVNSIPTLAWSFWDAHPQYDDDFGTVTVLTDINGLAMRVFSSMRAGDIYSLDASTGSMYFDFNIPSHIGNVQAMTHSTGTLVTINGTTELIFGSGCSPSLEHPTCAGPSYGYIWAIDALSTESSGTLLWSTQDFGGDIVSSPIVVNQGTDAVLYVLGPWLPGTATRGDLLALDPSSGAVLADYPVANHVYGAVSSPAVYGNRIFVTEGYSIYSNPAPIGGILAAFQCTGC
jgi:outer membrane protein assembly factor BamB